ncbi:phenoloxidase-activating enzyme-like isoform X2 [Adelges cooleyi]|uniref:phenoloxidase-activating enzyme-like isoform X2 n=1 Tax=Adelges cooleyi TaxID=133065 RepID=UPI0021809141|nr:phenoloxidase-activating enzyme-like isoform X2 [Adelges cooleyi]
MDKTLYVILVIRAVSTQTTDKCVLNTGKTGDCINIQNCPSLRGLLENEKQSPSVIAFLQTSICGFNGLHPKVCCPVDASPVSANKRNEFGQTKVTFQNDSTSTTTKGPALWRGSWAVSTTATTQTSKPMLCPCVLIQFCPSVRGLLKKYRGNAFVKSYIVNLICGYDQRYAKVYCPSFADDQGNHNDTYYAPSNCVENINATKYIFGFTTSSKTPFTSTTPQPVAVSTPSDKVLGPNKTDNPGVAPTVEPKAPPLDNLCGRTTIVRDRAVGREIPSLDDWPWLAALGYKIVSKPNNPLRWLCTGSLIAENYVLTAAHCAKTPGENKLSVVRLGDLNLDRNVSDGASPQDVSIAKIIVHESFNIENYTNDIALLKLETPITFKDGIKPICLPISPVTKSNTYVKYTPTIVGWDSTPSRQISNTAMIEVYAPIIDVAICESILKNESVVIDKSVFCAGYLAGGNDSCLFEMC